MSAVNYTTLNPIACVQIKQGIVDNMVPDGDGYVGLGVWEPPHAILVFGSLMRKYGLDISTAPYFMALCEAGTNDFTEFGSYTSAGNESFKPRGAIYISGEEEYAEFADYLGRPDLLTNQTLVRTELAFDAAYFVWQKHDLGSHCPARTNLRLHSETTTNGELGNAHRTYGLNPSVADAATLSYLNQVTGKDATTQAVQLFCGWVDLINFIQVQSANESEDAAHTRIKTLLTNAAAGLS